MALSLLQIFLQLGHVEIICRTGRRHGWHGWEKSLQSVLE